MMVLLKKLNKFVLREQNYAKNTTLEITAFLHNHKI